MLGWIAFKAKWLAAGGIGTAVVLMAGAAVLLIVLSTLGRWWWLGRARRAINPTNHGLAIVGIITGDDDYGTWAPEAPREMLASSWEITHTDSAVHTIERLLATRAGGDALGFDRVRAAHLARACAGARYLDQGSSWSYVARAGRDLQSYYDGWEDVGAAYARSEVAWRSARGLDPDDDTEKNLARLRRGLWARIPFDLDLP